MGEEEAVGRVERGVRRSEEMVMRRAKEVGVVRKVVKAEWSSVEAGERRALVVFTAWRKEGGWGRDWGRDRERE